jgi:hypothetical protein
MAYVLATGSCFGAPGGSSLRFALDTAEGGWDFSSEDTNANANENTGEASFHVARVFAVAEGEASFHLNTNLAYAPLFDTVTFKCDSNIVVFFSSTLLP